MFVQLKYLTRFAEVRTLTDDVKRLWYSHRENVLAEELGYPFSHSLLEELVEIFASMVEPPFLNFIQRVIELKNQVDRGIVKVGNPLHLILALTISTNRDESTVQREIIKAIVEVQRPQFPLK